MDMTKPFLPTYLYVKTHTVTGLKYFGKTTKSDPYKYLGSGVYWLRHCKKYGRTATTRIVGYYTDKEKCMRAAERFCDRHDIVDAVGTDGKKLWANCVPENGLDGGFTGNRKTSKATKKKISDSRIGYTNSPETRAKLSKAIRGRTLTEEHKEAIRRSINKPSVLKRIRDANLGKKRSPESVAKTAAKLTGRARPESFKEKLRGIKRSSATRRKMSLAKKGKVLSEETKDKIREARKLQVLTEDTRAKLSGFVCVVTKTGKALRVTKQEFYEQLKPDKSKSRYVAHRSLEGMRRLELRN